MNPLDFTKPITTRDGRKVRILCTDGPDKAYPVIGLIQNTISTWTLEGLYDLYSRTEPSSKDLINPSIKRNVEFWVNVYEGENASGCALRTISNVTYTMPPSPSRKESINQYDLH